jgi:hypothetical protein
MKKIKAILVVLGFLAIIIFQVIIYRQGLHPSPIDELVEKGMSDPKSFSFNPPEKFNRMELILKVTKGDGKAAFDLGCFYSTAELPEAAFYWFGISRKLGHEGISKDGLEFYEHNIIDKYVK